MKTVGIIGWRGLVGSVLIQRMIEENNFNNIIPVFFSLSEYNKKISILNINKKETIHNARNLDLLKTLDIIISCHGNKFTNEIFPKLRHIGWNGYWIDAASSLRMHYNSIIVLDPVNYSHILQNINNNIKNFIGGNCTVNLMLMALGGLFTNDLIEWISFSTYQAASGGGSDYIKDLILQMGFLYKSINKFIKNPAYSILKIEKKINSLQNCKILPQNFIKAPLVGNLLPWINNTTKYINTGQSYEEWKSQAEANKILNSKKIIPIDGLCVRINALRCHSQSFTIKLKKNISLQTIQELLLYHNSWVSIIPNNYEETINKLTPAAISGTLSIPIGRIHKLNIGNKYLSAFTVGDQLLWGSAEPLRRMLDILIKI